MKIGIVAPSPVPFTIGGAENLHWGLLQYINRHTPDQAELIKLPSPEGNLRDLVASYRRFCRLDLSHFDLLISTKYPAWMVSHDNHVCYMLHRLRGLYDTYYLCDQPEAYEGTDPSVLSLTDFMRRNRGRRAALAEFFQRWDDVCRRIDDHTGEQRAFRFPGPLAREVVHFLDGIGLSPGAIRKYAAISANVAGRRDYFPQPERVQVIYPPSNLKGFRRGPGEHFFTVSRLDGPKRIDLLIKAMRLAKADMPLKIAGTGPHRDRLRRLAGGDDRIEFLGFVNDDRVVDCYSRSLAVLFAPYDEDYGLVTVEAMMCAKPVITVTDAGGPNEFVEDGRTGFSTPPEPRAIAEKIDYLAQHPQEALEMGLRGRKKVAGITWANTVAALLEKAPPKPASRAGGAGGKTPPAARICVAVPFDVFPPRGGGQQRVFHLYRHLASTLGCRIDLVTLAHSSQSFAETEVAPGLFEVRVPKSTAHERAEQRISDEVGSIPVTDVAFPELFGLTPAYGQALEKSARKAAVVIVSHPYGLPAVRRYCSGKEVIYEAHNVEADLKAALLSGSSRGARLLAETAALERECCCTSRFVMACSEQDGRRLQERYGLRPERLWLVPNGVDLESVAFCPWRRRMSEKQRLGLASAFLALFTGSWHGPNVDALEFLLTLAPRLPDMALLVMGSVGQAVQDRRIPPNVGLLGVVDDPTREVVLHTVDVALNPMTSGSGTNLKMLEYAAAGIPILSTPHGARGLLLAEERFIELAEPEGFLGALMAMRSAGAQQMRRVTQARNCVVQNYDWMVIATGLAERLRRETDWFPNGGGADCLPAEARGVR